MRFQARVELYRLPAARKSITISPEAGEMIRVEGQKWDCAARKSR